LTAAVYKRKSCINNNLGELFDKNLQPEKITEGKRHHKNISNKSKSFFIILDVIGDLHGPNANDISH